MLVSLLFACGEPTAELPFQPAEDIDWALESFDAAPAPPGAITLTVTGLAPTEKAIYTVTGLAAGDNIVLVGTLDGAGSYCPPALGGPCFSIAEPAFKVGNARADVSGTASFRAEAPLWMIPGYTVSFQAVYPDGVSSVFTSVVDVVVSESVCPTLGASALPAGCPAACTGGCDDATCRVDCSDTSDCQVTTIDCPDGMNCIVQCSGLSACQVSTINCPDDGYCDINCSFTSTCQFLQVHGGNGATDLNCSGTSACQIGELFCGDGPCTSTCGGISASLADEHCAASCDCDLGC